MIRNMKNHVTLDLDDDDADIRYNCRDKTRAQLKQGLNNKTFSHQDQDKNDGLQKRNKI